MYKYVDSFKNKNSFSFYAFYGISMGVDIIFPN